MAVIGFFYIWLHRTPTDGFQYLSFTKEGPNLVMINNPSDYDTEVKIGRHFAGRDWAKDPPVRAFPYTIKAHSKLLVRPVDYNAVWQIEIEHEFWNGDDRNLEEIRSPLYTSGASGFTLYPPIENPSERYVR